MAVTLTIEDTVVPYLVLLFNSVVFYLLRINVNLLAPSSINLLLNEIISTVELCAGCAELGVVWEVHGNVGLAIALFLLCIVWSFGFGDAEACPCGPIEECLVVGRSFTSTDILQKLAGQLIGGYLTWKYTTTIWCWHLSEQHHSLHTHHCQATLFVSPFYGAAIEGLITFISRIVALESEHWATSVSIGANSTVTVLLVLFALNTTGGYFNPIMASALAMGCEGNTLLEHLSVYWIGSLGGGIVARWCHQNFLVAGHAKND